MQETKNTFLGSKKSIARKQHTCFTCQKIINPDGKTAIRHDVWKQGNTVVNKYFCPDCEILQDHQTKYYASGKTYNPESMEFALRFPFVFDHHFTSKYVDHKQKINAISDLQSIFCGGLRAKIFYKFFHKILGFQDWDGYKFRFDDQDYSHFCKVYRSVEHRAFYLFGCD